jgi:hypothetical protein
VILDAAPIIDGYPCDVAISGAISENPAYSEMQSFCESLREFITSFVTAGVRGHEFNRRLALEIDKHGYQVRHTRYPLRVLGHRLERPGRGAVNLGAPFQLAFLTILLGKALSGERVLINDRETRHALEGLWAIEPHLGDGNVGCKFEELLWVTRDGAQWLL